MEGNKQQELVNQKTEKIKIFSLKRLTKQKWD